jgi:3-hydroxyacyl-CoA dehydrogenase
MDDEVFKRVSVLGAAGKMGSGISLLLLERMATLSIQNRKPYILNLFDRGEVLLENLKPYLRLHLTKFAEKSINQLREWVANDPTLVSNKDIIERFVTNAMDNTNFVTFLEVTKGSTLVFEAIVEDVAIKCDVLRRVFEICNGTCYLFTNTSSIPISLLNEKAGLKNRIIGFHFYNPPAVQKLVEIIAPEGTDPQLKEIAVSLAKELKKTVVFSKDVAGFIGNGHFIPEAIFACKQAGELSKSFPLHESIYLVNRLTQDYLVRPMGIFQLIDYVGIDVFQKIAATMRTYLPDNSLQDPFIDKMIENRILGGQNSDGSQKDGFFQYTGTKPIKIYNFETKTYVPLETLENSLAKIGPMPELTITWKGLQKDDQRDEKLKRFSSELFSNNSRGCELAQEFLLHSRDLALKLVSTGTASSLSDVSTVLKTGFFHLYGPDAQWIPKELPVRGAK